MKKTYLIAGSLLLLVMIQPALASDETQKMHGHHMHGAFHGDKHNPCAMKEHRQASADMAGMHGEFMEETAVDGYTVSFQVMKAKEGMRQAGTHHLMIKVEKDGVVVTDLAANSKASHPNGQSESKMMMKMGDWFMAAYDLGHKGPHELTVLFKTADGVKHFTGIKFSAVRRDK